MKSIRVERHGGAEVLELREVAPVGEPGPGQAVVSIRTAGVNFMDIAQRRGDYPRDVPFTAGVEGAGVVSAVGADVHNVRVSDRVAFSGQPGAYAEEVMVDAVWLIPLPDEFTFDRGAAFPLQGMTAHYLIHEFRKPAQGDFVLVHAASGGLGGLLVQWARHFGATVIGTVSSAQKIATAQEAGADYVIVYTEYDFAAETMRITGGRGADLILDSVGQSTFKRDLDAVAWRGHIVCCGASSGAPEPIQPYALAARSASLSFGGRWARTPGELMSRAGDVIEGVRDGWLKLNIDTVLPLECAREAHALIESRRSQGKIVLAVSVES
jgi:NADPH2:quinone reductase